MTYNVFGGTLNPTQSINHQHGSHQEQDQDYKNVIKMKIKTARFKTKITLFGHEVVYMSCHDVTTGGDYHYIVTASRYNL